MSLQIRTSLTGGLGRCLNRNGLLLALAYVLVGAVWQVLLYSAVVTAVGQSAAQSGASALPTVDLPVVVSAGGAVVALVLLQYLTIVTIRTFVGGHTRTIPAEFYTRNIPYVLVNSIIGSLALGLVIFVGSILFVVPGIIAYVAFIFTLLYIAAEDQSFIAAFRSSWNVTRGNWLRLFGLLVIVLVAITIVPGRVVGAHERRLHRVVWAGARDPRVRDAHAAVLAASARYPRRGVHAAPDRAGTIRAPNWRIGRVTVPEVPVGVGTDPLESEA